MKQNQRIFIFLFTFFIVVAVGSIIFLNGKGSAFNRSRTSLGAVTAALSQTIIGDKKSETEVVETVPLPAPQEPEVTAPVAEEPTAEEPVAEEPADTSAEEGLRYFTFRTATQITILRMRKEPSEDAEIIHKLERNSTGYVVKPGNEWCRVATVSGSVGYCATEYLELKEVSADDFPKKFASMVEAPDEELSSKFGN